MQSNVLIAVLAPMQWTEKCARIEITSWNNSWMCLDCSTKSKVNCTSSPVLSIPPSVELLGNPVPLLKEEGFLAF